MYKGVLKNSQLIQEGKDLELWNMQAIHPIVPQQGCEW